MRKTKDQQKPHPRERALEAFSYHGSISLCSWVRPGEGPLEGQPVEGGIVVMRYPTVPSGWQAAHKYNCPSTAGLVMLKQ